MKNKLRILLVSIIILTIRFDLQALSSRSSPPVLTERALYQKAVAITVKVWAGQTPGSGILIDKQGVNYTIVTNRHVLIFGKDKSYQIATNDGKVYPAKVVNSGDFANYDLGLLKFESSKVYEVAPLVNSVSGRKGQEVFAAGFPGDALGGLVLKKGRIEMLSKLSFGGGYRLGLTVSLKKGMSGGPLLNDQGQVIGINGKHKYPLWGNPYLFEDGSLASPEQQIQMGQLSWAIPLDVFLDLAPQFALKHSF